MTRILLVEDNEMNRDMISRKLRRQGFEMLLAADGAEGIEKAAEEAPDLVLMDMALPVLDGYAATRLLKGNVETRDIPVIGLSAHAMTGAADKALAAGCDDYDTKPVEWDRLLAKIREALEKSLEATDPGPEAVTAELRDLREKKTCEDVASSEQRHSEHLLRVLFPEAIVDELKATRRVLPRRHPDVAVLFCAVAGFDSLCDVSEPLEVLNHLQAVVSAWEEIAEEHRVVKVKTVGDCLMAAAGLFPRLPNPVLDCVRCAFAMKEAAAKLRPAWSLRIGIHVGPVVAGVVGRKRYQFDLWGSTVRTAARVKAAGAVDAVNLSAAARKRLEGSCTAQPLVEPAGDEALTIYRVDSVT